MSGSILRIRYLDDGRPFDDFSLDQIGERQRCPFIRIGDFAAEIEQLLPYAGIIERLSERAVQCDDDVLWRFFEQIAHSMPKPETRARPSTEVGTPGSMRFRRVVPTA